MLTSEGGVNEYARDGENCYLTRPRDTEAMAQRVLHLLSDSDDRSRIRANGLATAQQFCHIDEADAHLKKYAEWMERRAARQAAHLKSGILV